MSSDKVFEIDPVWLSEAIGTVYDCVLAPDRWPRVIEAICSQLSFASGVLGIVQSRPVAHQFVSNYGYDDEWMALIPAYISESVALWGGPVRIDSFPLEEPIVASEIDQRRHWEDNRYYCDILKPRGLNEAVVVGLARNAHLNGYLAFNRHRSIGKVGPAERDYLRLLAPHVRRAVTITDLLDLKGLERATFRSVLDGMSSAVILVDEALRVVHMNRAAETLLAGRAPFDIVGERLSIAGADAQSALRGAVLLAAENETQLVRRGLGIPVRGPDDVAAILHVLPLHRGEVRSGLVQRAVAAVFVAMTGEENRTPVDAISLLYDLSPAERQVFAGIAQAKSIADTAAAIGVAPSTVRSHLLRVFEKTGCKRQPELVALASQLSLNL